MRILILFLIGWSCMISAEDLYVVDDPEIHNIRRELNGLQTYRQMTQEHYRRINHDNLNERYATAIELEVVQFQVEEKLEDLQEENTL